MALCAWKEARGDGSAAMQAVVNVILNTCEIKNHTPYAEVYTPFRYSSMTAPSDPQLLHQPLDTDGNYVMAQTIVDEAEAGRLRDNTLGATHYYADYMKAPPSWASTMTVTIKIGRQIFLK